MKSNFSRLLMIELFLILFSFFNLFILKNFNYFLYLFELVIIALVISKLEHTEKRRERFNIELLLIIFITVIFYYVVTYFFGFFSGFIYSSYSRSIVGIFRNVINCLILVLSLETIREKIIKNGFRSKLIWVLTPIALTLLEIPTIVNFSVLSDNRDILNAVISILIPYFSKNIFLTYSTYKTGKLNSVVYQLLMSIPTYILPIFPNLGDYFTAIIGLVLPIALLLIAINLMYVKRERIVNSRRMLKDRKIQAAITATLVIIVATMVYLTSNAFRFASLAIGSPSMTGSINKGDVVIIDKKKVDHYKKGQVLAFKQDGKVVVHRITKVDESDGNYSYKTKGDANNGEDAWVVNSKEVVGVVKVRLVAIGWPTVALSELINN